VNPRHLREELENTTFINVIGELNQVIQAGGPLYRLPKDEDFIVRFTVYFEKKLRTCEDEFETFLLQALRVEGRNPLFKTHGVHLEVSLLRTFCFGLFLVYGITTGRWTYICWYSGLP
jgi:hypothetical protein